MNLLIYLFSCGPGSSVGIATVYGLDGPGIESQWRRNFPHLSRPAMQMGTWSFPGAMCGRDVTLIPHHLPVPRSKQSNTSTLLKGLRGCERVKSTYLFSWLYSSLKKQLASFYSVKDTQNPASFGLSYAMFLFAKFTPLHSPEGSKMDAHLPTQIINVLDQSTLL